MSKTELERHLLEGLEKLQEEVAERQAKQDKKINQIINELNKQGESIQQLGDYYDNLKPLLQRLNGILRGGK
jgi:DNA-binding protein H-NS